VLCSFLEIYNETITDLLNPSASNLQIREDTHGEAMARTWTEKQRGGCAWLLAAPVSGCRHGCTCTLVLHSHCLHVWLAAGCVWPSVFHPRLQPPLPQTSAPRVPHMRPLRPTIVVAQALHCWSGWCAWCAPFLCRRINAPHGFCFEWRIWLRRVHPIALACQSRAIPSRKESLHLLCGMQAALWST